MACELFFISCYTFHIFGVYQRQKRQHFHSLQRHNIRCRPCKNRLYVRLRLQGDEHCFQRIQNREKQSRSPLFKLLSKNETTILKWFSNSQRPSKPTKRTMRSIPKIQIRNSGHTTVNHPAFRI